MKYQEIHKILVDCAKSLSISLLQSKNAISKFTKICESFKRHFCYQCDELVAIGLRQSVSKASCIFIKSYCGNTDIHFICTRKYCDFVVQNKNNLQWIRKFTNHKLVKKCNNYKNKTSAFVPIVYKLKHIHT